MHIFIDESGSFNIPASAIGPSISCAGALTVPDTELAKLEVDFLALTSSWPKEKGEIKGRLLDEAMLASCIQLFASRGAMFDCAALDLGLHTAVAVRAHQEDHAERILAHVTPKHQPSMVQELIQLQESLRALSGPEYIQVVTLSELVNRVVNTKLLWYVLRRPQELGAFHWRIDAKDRGLTRQERLWKIIILPMLESKAIRNPGIHLIDADYSAFARFDGPTTPPEHLIPHLIHWKPGQQFSSTNIRLVMTEDLQFESSASSVGLQMADVALSAAARAMRGNLLPAGWASLSSIMCKPVPAAEVVDMLRLQGENPEWEPAPPYYSVLAHLRRTAQDIVPH